MLDNINNILKQHNLDKKNRIISNEISIKPGQNNILISAPHTFTHRRKNKEKSRDYFTYSIARVLAELTNSHVIYINKKITYDPNFDDGNRYYNTIRKYLRENDIEYFIDIHGLMQREESNVDMGTNNYKNIDKTIVKECVKIFNRNNIDNVTIDQIFKSKYKTLSSKLSAELDIKAMQLEIGRNYRNIREFESETVSMINALIDIISFIENKDHFVTINNKDKLDLKDKMAIKLEKKGKKSINYGAVYDKVLDIKPSVGYQRELKGPIDYDQIGLELEVSVTMERDKYSFIKRLLKNIKEVIGDNGYFVKDATILGDYGFEIVLDPLKIDKIFEIYSALLDIFEFSGNLITITKNKNCGIHMNFNKHDVTDLNESHKRLTSLLSEKNIYFEQNIYKQSKFIWNYKEHLEYQNTVSSKYLWINYLKDKVVEVRNIRTDLNSMQLINLINLLLKALYCDKDLTDFEYQNYITLHKIYDTAFNKTEDEVFKSINEDGFVIISLKDQIPQIITIDEKTKKIIRKKI